MISDFAHELTRLGRDELENWLRRGVTPTETELEGFEFRGVNTPVWAGLVGIRKFCKGFYRKDGHLFGYNTPVSQGGSLSRWQVKPSAAYPKRFGFFRVGPVDPTARDNLYLGALLFDYEQGENPRFSPLSGLRDYLVRPDPQRPDVYLGKAYYALGPGRVPASFFVLDRWQKRSGTV